MKNFKFNAITALIVGFSVSAANAGPNMNIDNAVNGYPMQSLQLMLQATAILQSGKIIRFTQFMVQALHLVTKTLLMAKTRTHLVMATNLEENLLKPSVMEIKFMVITLLVTVVQTLLAQLITTKNMPVHLVQKILLQDIDLQH